MASVSIDSSLFDKVVSAYSERTNTQNGSKNIIPQLAAEFGISSAKVRKILFSEELLSNEQSVMVRKLYFEGKSIQEIIAITGLKKSSVNIYIPYSKGVYKDESTEDSIENLRVKKYRANKNVKTSLPCEKTETYELENHVVFYSANDLACGFHIEAVKRCMLEQKEICNLVDAIHVYNCHLYIVNKVYGRNWTSQEIEQIEKNSSLARNAVGMYLKNHPDLILDEFDSLEYDYKESVFSMADLFGVYKKWNSAIFKEKLSESMVRVSVMHEHIVNFFSPEICEYLSEHTDLAIDLIIQKNSINDCRHVEIFLPKDFGRKNQGIIIRSYLESHKSDIGILQSILKLPKDCVEISAEVQAKAQMQLDELSKKFFEENESHLFHFDMGVAFKKASEISGKALASSHVIEYSIEELDKRSNDVVGILYTFWTVFGFLDIQSGQIHLAKRNKYFTFADSLFSSKIKDGYNMDMMQSSIFSLTLMTLALYYDYLKAKGISLEYCLGTGFSLCLSEEFGINGFDFCLPEFNRTYYDSCTAIVPRLEYLFKGVFLICSGRQIDKYSMMEVPSVSFKLLKSLLGSKYAYVTDDKNKSVIVQSLLNILFSDQHIFYVEKIRKEGCKVKSNFELFNNYEISKAEIPDWDNTKLKYLFDHGCIVEFNNCIRLTKIAAALRELWVRDCISLHRTPTEPRVIRFLLSEGWLKTGDSLLSDPENKLLSYLYSNRDFSDALGIRNVYAHADNYGLSEDQHKMNYMLFLYMVIVLELKTLEDLGFYKEMKVNREKEENDE